MQNTNTRETIDIWHGSLTTSIRHFWPLTHFGSIEQAKVAIIAKAALDHKLGEPVLYRLKLSFESDSVFRIEDRGSPFYQAIFLHYCEALGVKDKEFNLRYREANNMGLSADDPEWLRWLTDLAELNGHGVLSYDNEVEGQGTSYSIVNMRSICLVSSTILPWEELQRCFKSIPHSDLGYSASDIKKMNDFLIDKIS